MQTDAVISIDRVTKRYGSGRQAPPVLCDISLQVGDGEFVAIVGKSGSGKSTLLHIIGGLDRRFEGGVSVLGKQLPQLSDAQISRLRNESLGFVFQQFNLLEHLSCLENVMMPTLFAAQSDPSIAEKRAADALHRVGLAGRELDLAAHLSGGQKQRVALARALFADPPILLCDEPTGNLDSDTGEQMIQLFADFNRMNRKTLIIVTHETRVSERAGRVVRLLDGRMV